MTTVNGQRLRVGDGTSGMTLTERQKGLAACACLMAQGDLERLEPTVRQALDNGVTINELKEAFSQLYAYTGFPRSLNALGVLSKVLENGRSSESHPSLLEDGRVVTDEGKANKQPEWQEGKPWKRPAEWDDAKKAYELGVKNQTCRSRDSNRSSPERSRWCCSTTGCPQAGRREYGQLKATGR